jgi:hypothetical protein
LSLNPAIPPAGIHNGPSGLKTSQKPAISPARNQILGELARRTKSMSATAAIGYRPEERSRSWSSRTLLASYSTEICRGEPRGILS